MSVLNEIRSASAKFYEALNSMANGDGSLMAEIWVNGADVTAQHPIGGRENGYESVIASFAKVADVAGGGKISLEEQRIDAGSDWAVETGVETGNLIIGGQTAEIHHRVTNVYRRMDGEWKLAHHHTDISESLLDVLKRLG